jgi:hypothetical protein
MRQTAAAPGADQHVDAKRALHQHGPRVARRAGRRRVSWPVFLADFRRQAARPIYRSPPRTLAGVPPIRRDLVKRHLYLVPNSIVVSRGCPHVCDFCYKEAFFEGGRSFYGAAARPRLTGRLRHAAYAAGWKKFEPLWDLVIRAKRAGAMLPLLESLLSEFGRRPAREALTPSGTPRALPREAREAWGGSPAPGSQRP